MDDERIDQEDLFEQHDRIMTEQMIKIQEIRQQNVYIKKKTVKNKEEEPPIIETTQKLPEKTEQISDFKANMKKYKNFEEYRNNTSFFDLNEKWLELISDFYQRSRGRKVLREHQFATVMYMAGQFMGKYIQPRGLLLFHVMGSGKTLTNIASAFYCLAQVPLYTEKSKIIFICNKALQVQVQNEVVKYINMLNKNNINESFQLTKEPLNPDDYVSKFNFITFNDSLSLNTNLFKSFDVIQNAFVIFDEAHNLFKSIGNDATRGNQIYHHLMSKNLQIQFNSGTPFSNDMSEIGICFNILSGNPNLFPITSLDALFVQQSPEADEQQYIKNKQVLMRRIVGLVSSAEIDANNEHFPQMKSLQLIQVPISPDYLQTYLDTRRQNLKTSKFMSDSHLLDNGYTAPDGKIVSNKFQVIKASIEVDPKPQILYSQYVTKGSILFADYCLQQNSNQSKYIWKQFNIDLYQQTPKGQNEIVFALVHGAIESSERMKIIGIFNSPENLNGDLINLICISKASVEGINIKYIRKVHIMEAQWETRDIQQVMSRGQRMFSHSLLPLNERVIRPYIYISFTSDQKYAFIKNAMNMSTDQQIYFKQQSSVPFQNTLFTLMHFVSFNCSTLQQFSYMDQVFKPDFHKQCFKCENTNQQLFNPKFIHQDLTTNNCKMSQKYSPPLQFTFNGMIYGLQIDLYAPFGFVIFELRDKYRKPLDSKTPQFQSIFIIAKETVHKSAKKQVIIIKDQESPQDDTFEETQNVSKEVSQFMPYVIVHELNQLSQFKEYQQERSRQLLSEIRAQSISFNMQTFDQFKIFTKLETRNNSDSNTDKKNYSLFQLFDIFVTQKTSDSNWQMQSRYMVGDIEYSFNEFLRRILKPFYIYLIEYVYVDIRINIKMFYDKFKQVIIFFNKQSKSLLEIIEIKLFKALLRTFGTTD